jgi:hypothetical protein
VQSRSATEPDSCGSARNKCAAPNSSEWAADCRNAAPDSCGCYMPAYCPVSSAARDRCCNRASRAAMLGRWRRKTERLHVPMADDWLGCRAQIAPGNFLPDWSFQNRLADGLDRLNFPALPRCVRCRCAANQCSSLHPWNCGSSYSSPRVAGSATTRVAGNSRRMTALHCPDDRSLLARCALTHRRRVRE